MGNNKKKHQVHQHLYLPPMLKKLVMKVGPRLEKTFKVSKYTEGLQTTKSVSLSLSLSLSGPE
jgi:hypothetical protein